MEESFHLSQESNKKLSITIYEDGFAHVHEQRSTEGYADESHITWKGLPERIDVESVFVAGLNVKEMSFNYDSLQKNTLLKRYVGQQVFLEDRQEKTTEPYELLACGHDLIVRHLKTGHLLINPDKEIMLPFKNGELSSHPTLSFHIRTKPAEMIDLNYLFDGLEWAMTYLIKLTDSKLELIAQASISNDTNYKFEDAEVKLIAGTVKKYDNWFTSLKVPTDDYLYDAASASMPVEPEQFHDRELYTVPHPISLQNHQKKQVDLFNINDIKYEKVYHCTPRSSLVKQQVRFENSWGNQLGIPLPKGVYKIYSEHNGSYEFLGEDDLEHKISEDRIEIDLGEASGLKAEFKELKSYKEGYHKLTDIEVTLKNSKSEAEEFVVTYPISRYFLRVKNESEKVDKQDRYELIFKVVVESYSKAKLEFTIVEDESIHLKHF
ncbi:DUF4139 domain-containing protein [Halalkalibacillus halophilus]|uniref:DUF4139 domain-containing protein n=1 Tax=Halalkalibacillus halophilus TaxID=392827 RepID=UPI0003F6BD27|nr:hypothetical protein [Halalkalibacillus halophilus]